MAEGFRSSVDLHLPMDSLLHQKMNSNQPEQKLKWTDCMIFFQSQKNWTIFGSGLILRLARRYSSRPRLQWQAHGNIILYGPPTSKYPSGFLRNLRCPLQHSFKKKQFLQLWYLQPLCEFHLEILNNISLATYLYCKYFFLFCLSNEVYGSKLRRISVAVIWFDCIVCCQRFASIYSQVNGGYYKVC